MSHKKPVAALKRAGTYRPDRHGRGSLPVEVPPKPAGMSPEAEAFWNVATKQLEYAGFVSRVDGPALQLMCETWAAYREADRSISEMGVTVLSDTKYGQVLKTNPAAQVRASTAALLFKMFQQFGMTCVARNGLTPIDHSDEEDEEARVAGILKIKA